MAKHPDICVWFEVSNGFIPENELPVLGNSQNIKEETIEMITDSQSNEEDNLDDIDFVASEDSYFFRIHSSFKKGPLVFPLFTNGWQNIPFRAFLEINPQLKISFTSLNNINLCQQINLLPSKKNQKTSVKNYLIYPIFVDSSCSIENIIFYVDYFYEGPYLYFTLTPF